MPVKGHLYKRVSKDLNTCPDSFWFWAFEFRSWENCECGEIKDKACRELPAEAYGIIDNFLDLADTDSGSSQWRK